MNQGFNRVIPGMTGNGILQMPWQLGSCPDHIDVRRVRKLLLKLIDDLIGLICAEPALWYLGAK